MKEKAKKLRKVPFVVSMMYAAVFIISDFFIWISAIGVKMVTPQQVLMFFTSQTYLVCIVIKYIICAVWFQVNMKHLVVYDGTPEKLKKAEKAIQIVEISFLGLEVFFVIIQIMILAQVPKFRPIKINFAEFALMHIGASSIFACFNFFFFLEAFEKWVTSFIPIKSTTRAWLPNKARIIIVSVMNTLGQLLVMIASFVNFEISDSEVDFIRFMFYGFVPSMLVFVLMSLLSTFLQVHNNARNLKIINNVLKNVAKSDYTLQVNGVYNREEYGQIAASSNEMIAQTKSILKDIQETSMASHVIARELDVQAGVTAQAVDKIMENSNVMTDSVIRERQAFDKIEESAKVITDNIESLDNDVQSQVAAVEQSTAAIEEMVSNIRSVTAILEKNAKAVGQLSDASTEGKQKIAESVASAEKILKDSAGLLEASTVIQNIAEQTNLLAMNAAIEAAHAGESGRGFAVVANEIRKLAEDSNKQGRVITDSLQKLQESIKEISSTTTAVRDNFNLIYDLTDTVHNQEDVIKAAMDEQSAGSTQVLDAVRQLSEISTSVTTSTKEMMANNKQIGEDMVAMSSEIKSFTSVMNGVVRNATEISMAITDTKDASGKNNIGIQKLRTAVERFVV